MTTLNALAQHGQSIWLDYIRRGMTRSGELQRWVEQGVTGVTSNPSIFQKAIGESDDYRDELATLLRQPDLDPSGLYERLAIEDIREAAAVLRSVYDATGGADGFVSLEVAPSLALDAEGTIADARRLWTAVGAPNLMIKVPGTPQGITAVRQLIAEGINVNVTLIFSGKAYEGIAQAYIDGLEARVRAGLPIDRIASVASFFVSRIDSDVDERLGELVDRRPDTEKAARKLVGRIAVANAKLAYATYQRIVQSPQWQLLRAKGARPQRLLWASTGTKNPAYSDVLYVDELIGRDTVNTVPPATLAALIDHGKVTDSLTADVERARADIDELAALGISLDEVTDRLLDQGLGLFSQAMDGLLGTIANQQRSARGPRMNRTTLGLPARLREDVYERAKTWIAARDTARLWAKDASLWSGSDEARWLGWLDIVDAQRTQLDSFRSFADEVRNAGIRKVLLLGMGGSSLCPDVLARTYGAQIRARDPRAPELRILDSTVPAQVRSAHRWLDRMDEALIIVASKSGSTLEPNAFMASFLDRAQRELGEAAGRRFVAITDPGSQLEAFAKGAGFWKIFHGVPEIGGRYSALSHFGMIPAAAIGIDVAAFLGEAAVMLQECRNEDALGNPGVALGLVLGTAATHGIDKVTVVTPPAIGTFGAWLEQLVAESTGKQGKAIIPFESEPLAAPEVYGKDRLFVQFRVLSAPDATADRAVERLEAAGHPVVRIELDDTLGLAQELLRWEFATAVASVPLAINPFDQPDVEASKIASRRLTDHYEKTRQLPETQPVLEVPGLRVFADERNAADLGHHGDVVGWIRAHLQRIASGDYFAILAYLEMTPEHERRLQRIRTRVRDTFGVATSIGFGPRFLHSTGQAHKGGPNTGVFVQITSDDAEDLEVPGKPYGFSIIKSAQAGGDLQVLNERGRRALRIHLGADVTGGLVSLERAFDAALQGLGSRGAR